MKVGIITFHRAINYGAVLQCLALQKVVKKLGHECEVIDYECLPLEKGASPFYIRSFSPRDLAVFLTQIIMRTKKNRRFKQFVQNNIKTTSKCYTPNNIDEISDLYDVYITGSDQVWNYEITDLDSAYFLDFVINESKKASYGASFGVATIPDKYSSTYKKYLSSFSKISVREYEAVELVKKLTGKESTTVLDPVFLLDKEEWSVVAKKPEHNQKYILVYSINKTGCYQYAQKLSEQTGIPIVGLLKPTLEKTRCAAIRTGSPDEYVGWFENAEYIITDSFHGAAFSIIFNKQFVVFLNNSGRASRQVTLLKRLGLENRIETDDTVRKMFEPIEYDVVNKTVDHDKKLSVEYLKGILSTDAN